MNDVRKQRAFHLDMHCGNPIGVEGGEEVIRTENPLLAGVAAAGCGAGRAAIVGLVGGLAEFCAACLLSWLQLGLWGALLGVLGPWHGMHPFDAPSICREADRPSDRAASPGMLCGLCMVGCGWAPTGLCGLQPACLRLSAMLCPACPPTLAVETLSVVVPRKMFTPVAVGGFKCEPGGWEGGVTPRNSWWRNPSAAAGLGHETGA